MLSPNGCLQRPISPPEKERDVQKNSGKKGKFNVPHDTAAEGGGKSLRPANEAGGYHCRCQRNQDRHIKFVRQNGMSIPAEELDQKV
jgi:hypothetical protein